MILASALPAIIGLIQSRNGFIYSGVVFNPVDGYTYLAKMEIGNSGDWLFSLPFTAQSGEGRVLYPFYIAAGHFLQVTGISLSIGFNIFRLIAYGCLALVLIRLANHLLQNKGISLGVSIILLAAGGGLGWILLPFGKYGADFWVSEAFPFLAGLANPHFPLAIACMVLTVCLLKQVEDNSREVLIYGLMGFFLSVLSPFGFVLISCVLILAWVWERRDKQPTALLPVLVSVAAGLPYSIYQYWAVGSTPQLAAWTAQNQTPSPVLWDVLLSFSPWIILVIMGWRYLFTQRNDPVVRRLIIWTLTGLILTIIPFNLQRRFMIGLSIPITSLGLLALSAIAQNLKISSKRLLTFCTVIAIPTTLLVLIMVSFAVGTHSPLYFYQKDELAALEWLSLQGDGKSLVLASEQTGLLIPAASRLRVLYGHPFESVDSAKEKQDVANFFAGNLNSVVEMDYLKQMRVDWIFYGSREQELGIPEIIKGMHPAMQFGSVKLFDVAEIKE